MTILTVQSGFNTMLGALAAIGVCVLAGAIIYNLVKYVKNEYRLYKSKPKFVLDNWDSYIAQGYFEELELLKKYKEQLKKGEWPLELEDMFEWKDNGKGARTDHFGDLYLYKKSFLTLKAKYKKAVKKDQTTAPKDENPDKGDINNNEDKD